MEFSNQAGNSKLHSLLNSDDIVPGSSAGYETCKNIYLYHPHGSKIVDGLLDIALHKDRIVSFNDGPSDLLLDLFQEQWEKLQCLRVIRNHGRIARIYGVGTIGLVSEDDSSEPLNLYELPNKNFSLVVWDSLNTSGSFTSNQNPNSVEFQKYGEIKVFGNNYHASRCCPLFNGDPIYLNFSDSGYGYVGQSVYQRALSPLKSFIQTMTTDNMVSLKAGVIVAKQKSNTSAIDAPMAWIFGKKREIINRARTDNTISIGLEESIESIDLHNLEGTYQSARKNIIENIAAGSDTPAKLLLSESLAEGFGEGSEDARMIAIRATATRNWLKPSFDFCDKIVLNSIITEDLFNSVKESNPAIVDGLTFKSARSQWIAGFSVKYPDLIDQGNSSKKDDNLSKINQINSVFSNLVQSLPSESVGHLVEWYVNSINSTGMSEEPLELDIDSIAEYVESNGWNGNNRGIQQNDQDEYGRYIER